MAGVAPLTKIRDNASHCFLFEAPEVCREEVSFEISESELRRAAAAPGAWAFKFTSDKGYEHRTAITPAEIEGLLKAVDTYRRTLPAPRPRPTPRRRLNHRPHHVSPEFVSRMKVSYSRPSAS
jgi:hypothetical protein